MNWKEKALRAAAIAALLEADWYYRWAEAKAKEDVARALVAAVLADCLKDTFPPERYREAAQAAIVCIRNKRGGDLTLKYDEGAVQRVVEVLKEALNAEQGEQAEAVAQDA